jgi:diguanylate cyclase (GGDEF)-like protein
MNAVISRTLSWMERLSPLTVNIFGVASILALGYLDHVTGPEIDFSILYILPIIFVLFLTRTATSAITLSFISAAVWLAADISSGHLYPNALLPAWNMIMRLGYFIIISLLLNRLKISLKNEKKVSRTDALTGINNSRSFYELSKMETERSYRYKRPLTLAYIDLDNFKNVNDSYGHLAGDQLLCVIADSMRDNLRSSDILARLGGDEFAVLLPETETGQALNVLTKLQILLTEKLRVMNIPVTFSMGVGTFIVPPDSVDKMIEKADYLMYSVKRNGKNSLKHEVFN